MAEYLDAFHKALDLIPRPQKSVEKYNLVQLVSLAHCSCLKHSHWETFFSPIVCFACFLWTVKTGTTVSAGIIYCAPWTLKQPLLIRKAAGVF